MKYTENIIKGKETARNALKRLNELAGELTLFVVDERHRLIGRLTDGDVRRGLLNGLNISDKIERFIGESLHYLKQNAYTFHDLQRMRERKLSLIPVVNEAFKIVDILDLEAKRSLLPVDAVIIAGGRGERLRPFTDHTPKPMLQIDGKPIIEYNVDRLALYGVNNLYISINYLGEQLVSYFGDGIDKGLDITYIKESRPMGTIGAISKVEDFRNDYILAMNSDLLTNIDFEDFFNFFQEEEADMAVVSVPYKVDIPYAIIDSSEGIVKGFHEKPSYTYYTNGGIYLMKKDVLRLVPKNRFFNATNLMEKAIEQGKKLVSYPMLGYWLDIGKPQDFQKAQEDIKHIVF